MPEIRNVSGEIRATDEAKFQIQGRAVVYNTPSAVDVPYPDWHEVILPGAFKGSMPDAGLLLLWNHQTGSVMGSERGKTLVIDDNQNGLDFTVQLDRNSPDHQSWFSSVRRGDTAGCSFSFVPISDAKDQDRKLRTVRTAELIEITITPFPAYPATSIQARAEKRVHYDTKPTESAKLRADAIATMRRAAEIMAAPKRRALFNGTFDYLTEMYGCQVAVGHAYSMSVEAHQLILIKSKRNKGAGEAGLTLEEVHARAVAGLHEALTQLVRANLCFYIAADGKKRSQPTPERVAMGCKAA
ncbi:MAG: HK97 family phage prohead protease, partial [Terriglobia bacterium]